MLKKILAVAALSCALLTSQAFAYETGEYSREALRRGDDKPKRWPCFTPDGLKGLCGGRDDP